MNATTITCRLFIALAASALLAVPASADDSHERELVAKMKRIQAENDRKQRELEATPEYQEKKRVEAEERQRKEEEKRLAKLDEMEMRLREADVKNAELLNAKLRKEIELMGNGGGQVGFPGTSDNGGGPVEQGPANIAPPSGMRIGVLPIAPRPNVKPQPVPPRNVVERNIGGLKVTPPVRIAPGLQIAGRIKR